MNLPALPPISPYASAAIAAVLSAFLAFVATRLYGHFFPGEDADYKAETAKAHDRMLAAQSLAAEWERSWREINASTASFAETRSSLERELADSAEKLANSEKAWLDRDNAVGYWFDRHEVQKNRADIFEECVADADYRAHQCEQAQAVAEQMERDWHLTVTEQAEEIHDLRREIADCRENRDPCGTHRPGQLPPGGRPTGPVEDDDSQAFSDRLRAAVTKAAESFGYSAEKTFLELMKHDDPATYGKGWEIPTEAEAKAADAAHEVALRRTIDDMISPSWVAYDPTWWGSQPVIKAWKWSGPPVKASDFRYT